MEVCITPEQLNTDFDKISEFFITHYDKNIETELTPDDQQLLDDVSNKLNELASTQNVNFNKDGFKTLIKKLYVYDFTQFGGEDGIVPYSGKKTNPPNKFDLFAIIILISSIFLLYISFLKFNELSQSVTGMAIDQISEDVKSQVQVAIAKIGELPTEQITFVQYVWSSIQTFSCSIVETQTQRLRNIVTESLSNTIQDFTAIAERTCMPRTEVITEGVYSISSSITGNIDLGRALNSLVQVASSATSASSTSSCITNTALSLQRRAIDELFHQQGLILNQITAQSTQAINFLTYGASMGTSSILYLVYRTRDVLGIAYVQFKPQIKRGGKKYTKKNRKHRKHKKTHKRKNKKYTHKRR